jgi:hypothetical protein
MSDDLKQPVPDASPGPYFRPFPSRLDVTLLPWILSGWGVLAYAIGQQYFSVASMETRRLRIENSALVVSALLVIGFNLGRRVDRSERKQMPQQPSQGAKPERNSSATATNGRRAPAYIRFIFILGFILAVLFGVAGFAIPIFVYPITDDAGRFVVNLFDPSDLQAVFDAVPLFRAMNLYFVGPQMVEQRAWIEMAISGAFLCSIFAFVIFLTALVFGITYRRTQRSNRHPWDLLLNLSISHCLFFATVFFALAYFLSQIYIGPLAH